MTNMAELCLGLDQWGKGREWESANMAELCLGFGPVG